MATQVTSNATGYTVESHFPLIKARRAMVALLIPTSFFIRSIYRAQHQTRAKMPFPFKFFTGPDPTKQQYISFAQYQKTLEKLRRDSVNIQDQDRRNAFLRKLSDLELQAKQLNARLQSRWNWKRPSTEDVDSMGTGVNFLELEYDSLTRNTTQQLGYLDQGMEGISRELSFQQAHVAVGLQSVHFQGHRRQPSQSIPDLTSQGFRENMYPYANTGGGFPYSNAHVGYPQTDLRSERNLHMASSQSSLGLYHWANYQQQYQASGSGGSSNSVQHHAGDVWPDSFTPYHRSSVESSAEGARYVPRHRSGYTGPLDQIRSPVFGSMSSTDSDNSTMYPSSTITQSEWHASGN